MRSDGRRSLRAVLAITALALAVRLLALGARIFHWDEGRVGYWILRYHETGEFAYRPIVHGPFLFVVNDWVFSVPGLGASDFSARLIVAVVGGCLPLSAWLLRDRLRDTEVVALALVLAANPLLVYYSRFMRNDVLVGAFAFAALAVFVRGLDRGDARYLYPAAALLGLAFTTKENAVVYLLCVLGAGALLVDHRLYRRTRDGASVVTLVRSEWRTAAAYRLASWGGSVRRGLGLAVAHSVAAVVVFVAVVTFFYAPRPDLWQALAAPGRLPGVVESATVGSWETFFDLWVSGSHQSHDYLPFLYDYLETLLFGAPFVVLFAVVGFVADGYGAADVDTPGSRSLVAFATYWGAVSVVGYPIATDIRAPWAAVHAVIPLAVPAAVGVVTLGRQVRTAVERGRSRAGEDGSDVVRTLRAAWTPSAALAALLLCGAVAGVVGANATYTNSTDDDEAGEVIQWAQPENDLKETLALVRGVVRVHDEGPDVLFVGTHAPGNPSDVRFHVTDEGSLAQPRPGGPSWHTRLPLPWYLERYGAAVTSTPPDDKTLGADPPPVIVAASWDADVVDRQLTGYSRHRHDFRLWNDEIVVFVEDDALDRARDRGYA